MFMTKQFTRLLSSFKGSFKPLSAIYLKNSEEKGFNRLRTYDRDYLINLKKDPDSKYFFKFCEESNGKRSNMFFGAGKDSEVFIQSLQQASKAPEDEVFASWTSEMFENRSVSMQRIKNNQLLITEEDLTEGKSRKIHLDVKLIDRVINCIELQLKEDSAETSVYQASEEVHFDRLFFGQEVYFLNLKKNPKGYFFKFSKKVGKVRNDLYFDADLSGQTFLKAIKRDLESIGTGESFANWHDEQNDSKLFSIEKVNNFQVKITEENSATCEKRHMTVKIEHLRPLAERLQNQLDIRNSSINDFEKSEEITSNNFDSPNRKYFINLKKDENNKYFFKFSEKSFGMRANIYFGAGQDAQQFSDFLKLAYVSKRDEVFGSFKSQTFPNQTISFQRVEDSDVIITQEDLSLDKAKKVIIDIKLARDFCECIQKQMEMVEI